MKSQGTGVEMRKFYPLVLEDFVKMREELTAAQKDILLYLRLIDPFGDKNLDIGIRELARKLKLNPSTISRGLEILRDKNYIAMEIMNVRVRLKSIKEVEIEKMNCGKLLRPSNSVGLKQQKRSQCNKFDPEATDLIEMQQLEAETKTEQSFENAKTIKTNKTNQIRSIELENFEKIEDQIQIQNQEIEKAEKPKLRFENENLEGEAEPESNDKKADQKLGCKIDQDENLADFIIRTVEERGNISINSRESYVERCLKNNGQHWRSLYQESKKPIPKVRDSVAENIFLLMDSLAGAIRINDLEFARERLNGLPDMREQIFKKRPEWKELLCG